MNLGFKINLQVKAQISGLWKECLEVQKVLSIKVTLGQLTRMSKGWGFIFPSLSSTVTKTVCSGLTNQSILDTF